ncbi:MAG: hypothetical protein IJ736_03985 [Firmicutes bacterium]|nr:hypothetical protein [Bacillota bacterium]
MWGICSLCESQLSQRAIEYQIKDNNTAVILQPASNIEIDIKYIKAIDAPPKFKYGDSVSPADHIYKKGRIRDIIWHGKTHKFNYYIEIDNKKVSRRYYAEELIRTEDGL